MTEPGSLVADGVYAVTANTGAGGLSPGWRPCPTTARASGRVDASGQLLVRATAVGVDTQLTQMARLVTEAQAGKAPVQRLAD
jgi:Cu+-exporting ATPase